MKEKIKKLVKLYLFVLFKARGASPSSELWMMAAEESQNMGLGEIDLPMHEVVLEVLKEIGFTEEPQRHLIALTDEGIDAVVEWIKAVAAVQRQPAGI